MFPAKIGPISLENIQLLDIGVTILLPIQQVSLPLAVAGQSPKNALKKVAVLPIALESISILVLRIPGLHPDPRIDGVRAGPRATITVLLPLIRMAMAQPLAIVRARLFLPIRRLILQVMAKLLALDRLIP